MIFHKERMIYTKDMVEIYRIERRELMESEI